MKLFRFALCLVFAAITTFAATGALGQATASKSNALPTAAAPATLPLYDHIVIVMDENKDYDEIVGAATIAPYINGTLRKEGASLTKMYGEEHHSEGNYFWLFSGARPLGLNYEDGILKDMLTTSNLGLALIQAKYSFKGYSEDLPAIGSVKPKSGKYARKHVPWVSFSNLPNGATVADSSNLRFADFPSDFNLLPTVSFVIPNLDHDMHDGSPPQSITDGDTWLKDHLGSYYTWAKQHNSLLIVTFDEDDHAPVHGHLTDPAAKDPNKQNRIATILAGAHIKPGDYDEGNGVTHVNLLRTVEAIYKLSKSGAQQQNAVKAGIADDYIITDTFATAP